MVVVVAAVVVVVVVVVVILFLKTVKLPICFATVLHDIRS